MQIDEVIVFSLLGKKIKSYRKKTELTQEALATCIGVSRSSIANYEIGNQAVYLDDLYRIADCLKVNVEKLLPSLEDIKTKSSFKSVLDEASNLKNKHKQEIKNFIENVTK